ncbi:MAG TPA: GerMN domain-containing protein [Mycobacteriales bacterium]|nr:GerMN domain-containing protein [Mycobacteriales bacterium]
MLSSPNRCVRGAATASLLVLLLAGCNSGATEVSTDAGDAASSGGPSAGATADPESSAEPTEEPGSPPAPTATPAPGTTTAALYYLVETRNGIRLQREFRQVPRSDAPTRAALDAMFREPALDRDYSSLWPRATRVRGIARSGGTVTVDLSRAALDGEGGAEATAMSVQQVVHTVTAADRTISGVRILVEGREVTDLWGHESLAGRTLRRGSHIDVLAFVAIDSPSETAEVTRTFVLSGSATVFEANVQWRVTRGCPADVTCVGAKPTYASGFVTASAGAPARGTWSVQVTVPEEVLETSGYIEITAFEESAEDGAEIHADTKVVRVVG